MLFYSDEEIWYIKNKSCCSCKYFSSYMGSAGYCKAQNNRIEDMIDVMDTCHNGKYRWKPSLPVSVVKIYYDTYCMCRRLTKKVFRKYKKYDSEQKEIIDIWDD